MRKHTLQPAFSLLEAVIASAILVIMMGVGLSAVRTIEENSAKKDQNTEMASLADSQISQFISVRDYVRNNGLGTVKAYLSLPAAGTPMRGAFVASSPPQPANCNNMGESCGPTIKGHGPIVLNWCAVTDPTCGLNMPVIAVPLGNAQTLANQYASIPLQGYLVALRRTQVNNNTLSGDSRYSIGPDMLEFDLSSQISTLSPTTQQNFDLYIVSVSITQLGGGSYDPVFNQDAGQPMPATPLSAIKPNTYQVDVKVTSFYDESLVVKKSITFTD